MAAAAAPADTKVAAAAEEASAMGPPAIAYIQPLEADPQYSSMYLPSYEALPGIMILHSLSSSLWTLSNCKMRLMRA
jgi:hypothetical protein